MSGQAEEGFFTAPRAGARRARTKARARWSRLLTAATERGGAGHVGRGQALHVAQQEDLAVGRSEVRDGGLERGPQPAIVGEAVGAPAWIAHFSRPPALALHRHHLGGVAAPPPLLDAEAAGDRVEPGRRRRVPPEAAERPCRRQERLLDDVLGVGGVAAKPEAETQDPRLEATEQCFEGRTVARLRFGQELRLGHLRIIHEP